MESRTQVTPSRCMQPLAGPVGASAPTARRRYRSCCVPADLRDPRLRLGIDVPDPALPRPARGRQHPGRAVDRRPPGRPGATAGRSAPRRLPPQPPATRPSGTGWSRRFGDRLPFLVKALAAAQPLSLQVHPTSSRARDRLRPRGRGRHPGGRTRAQLPGPVPQARDDPRADPLRGHGRLPGRREVGSDPAPARAPVGGRRSPTSSSPGRRTRRLHAVVAEVLGPPGRRPQQPGRRGRRGGARRRGTQPPGAPAPRAATTSTGPASSGRAPGSSPRSRPWPPATPTTRACW